MAATPSGNGDRGMTDFSLAILAGGESSRMGRNKALMGLGGKPVISHVIDALRGLSDDIFIVGGESGEYRHLGLAHAPDSYDFRASIVGVYSALAAARHDFCLVVSCDMPFAGPGLATLLAASAAGRDAVVPVSAHGLEPLFALYAKSCLGVLRRQIESGRLTIRGALDRLDVCELPVPGSTAGMDQERAFLNLNTADDLRRAERILAAGDSGPGPEPSWPPPEGMPARAGGPPLICFVGKKNSGKTTFLVRLVSLLTSEGLAVAFIKHDAHGFSMDREGTDTWRLAQAGAREVAISSPEAFASIRKTDREPGLAEIHAGLGGGADIVIAEGFKGSGADRIEISRRERSESLACNEVDLVAIVSDYYQSAKGLPVFSLQDVAGVAGFLRERYRLEPVRQQGVCR